MPEAPRPELVTLTAKVPEADASSLHTPELQQAAKKSVELRKIEQQNPDNGKKIFEAAGGRIKAPITQREATLVVTEMGGAQETPSTPEAQVLKNEAKDIMEKIVQTQIYASIVQEKATKPGIAPEDILTDRIKKGEITWLDSSGKLYNQGNLPDKRSAGLIYNQLRQNALSSIYELPVIKDNFPELAVSKAIGSPGLRDIHQQQSYIEDFIVSDPRFRELVSEGMAPLLQRVKDLDAVSTDTQQAKEQERDIQKSTIADQEKALEDRFPGLDVKTIREVLRDNPDVASFQDGILQRLAEAKLGSREMADYIRLRVEEQRLTADIARVQAEATALNAGGKSVEAAAKTAEAKRLEFMRDKEVKPQADHLQSTVRTIKSLKPDEQSQAERDYIYIEEQVKGRQQRDGTRVGGIENIAREITVAQTTLRAIDREISAIAKDPENIKRLNARLSDEAAILNEMSGVLEQSVAELLNERHDQTTFLLDQQAAKAAEKATQDGEAAKAQAIKEIRENMRTNWVHFDGRKRIVERELIGDDMRTLAYEGEDGLKRMLLMEMTESVSFGLTADDIQEKKTLETIDPSRRTGEQNKRLAELEARGRGLTNQEAAEKATILAITATSRTPEQKTRLSQLQSKEDAISITGDLSELSPDQRVFVDAIRTSVGDAYVTQLLTDYSLALSEPKSPKRFWQRELKGTRTDLWLRPHERALIDSTFGATLARVVEKAAASNPQASVQLAKEKEKNKGKLNFKALMAILVGLGMASSLAMKTFSED